MADTSRTFKSVSIGTFAAAFPDEDACVAYLFHHAGGLAHRCQGADRRPRWRRVRSAKKYFCADCRKIKGTRSSTAFKDTKIPVRSIFYAMLLMLEMPGHTSAMFFQRQLGISGQAAVRLLDRLRLHIAALEFVRVIGGPGRTVWIDETLVKRRGQRAPTCVFGITDSENLFLKIVPNRRAQTVLPLIEEAVAPGSVIVTDGFRSYDRLSDLGWAHHCVNHSKGMWKDEAGRTTAPIDSVWRWLKRQVGGTNGPASDDKMWSHIKQFLYKFHARADPSAAFWKLVSTYPPPERSCPDLLRAEVDGR